MLATFQSHSLMHGNLVDTSRDNLLFKFHNLLSLDGTCEYILLTSKEKTRVLRFASNPKVRVSFIVRKCLKIPFPLSMIVHKKIKGPQLNIS